MIEGASVCPSTCWVRGNHVPQAGCQSVYNTGTPFRLVLSTNVVFNQANVHVSGLWEEIGIQIGSG